MTTAIHRAARHALPDDPWRAEKVAQAERVTRDAMKLGPPQVRCDWYNKENQRKEVMYGY